MKTETQESTETPIGTQIVVQDYEGILEGFVSTNHTLILVADGVKTLNTDCGTYTITTPNMLMVPRNMGYNLINKNGTKKSYKAYCLFLDTDRIRDFYQKHMIDNKNCLEVPLVLENQQELADALMRLYEVDVPYSVMCSRHDEIIAWLAHNNIYLATSQDDMITKVRKIIVNAPNHRWLISDVARQLAVGESSLRRMLQAQGQSFTQLVDNCRTSYACGLLQSTDYSMERIARESGYSNAYRFSQKFKERFGVTPAKFRQ